MHLLEHQDQRVSPQRRLHFEDRQQDAIHQSLMRGTAWLTTRFTFGDPILPRPPRGNSDTRASRLSLANASPVRPTPVPQPSRVADRGPDSRAWDPAPPES